MAPKGKQAVTAWDTWRKTPSELTAYPRQMSGTEGMGSAIKTDEERNQMALKDTESGG